MKKDHDDMKNHRLVFDVIFDAIILASKNNGRVFGGFVRDVIVRIESEGYEKIKTDGYEKIKDCNFKDVDIWFQTNTDAKNFIDEMGSKFVHIGHVTDDPEWLKEIYPFSKKPYYLVLDNIRLPWFDIIVYDTIPVDDFDVNTLTFQIKDGKFTSQSYCSKTEEVLIDSIKTKRAELLPKYANRIKNPVHRIENEHIQDETYFSLENRLKHGAARRIETKYIKKGWKICYQGATCETLADLHETLADLYDICVKNEYQPVTECPSEATTSQIRKRVLSTK
jgi:hypothetical protein